MMATALEGTPTQVSIVEFGRTDPLIAIGVDGGEALSRAGFGFGNGDRATALAVDGAGSDQHDAAEDQSSFHIRLLKWIGHLLIRSRGVIPSHRKLQPAAMPARQR